LSIHNFNRLEVWQRARKLCKTIYEVTSIFPKSEQFGLTSQIRRASISIASNIAEGSGRNSKKEFTHFLSISNGSAFEVETQIYISRDLNYIDKETEESIIEELQIIQKMLNKLIVYYS
jgi:four helix bundle protein